jgi:periplasmic divalent cation tolerance protein
MKSPVCYIVLVTAPDEKTARALAHAALRTRSAACVNLLPGVESHYWWKGKLEAGSEILMIFKTTQRRLAALKRLILEEHPYETAEFIAFKITAGSKRYLEWIGDSVS